MPARGRSRRLPPSGRIAPIRGHLGAISLRAAPAVAVVAHADVRRCVWPGLARHSGPRTDACPFARRSLERRAATGFDRTLVPSAGLAYAQRAFSGLRVGLRRSVGKLRRRRDRILSDAGPGCGRCLCVAAGGRNRHGEDLGGRSPAECLEKEGISSAATSSERFGLRLCHAVGRDRHRGPAIRAGRTAAGSRTRHCGHRYEGRATQENGSGELHQPHRRFPRRGDRQRHGRAVGARGHHSKVEGHNG